MYDILIKNGTIIDGSGEKMFKADVGVNNGEIADIGDLSNEKGEIEVDAKDKYVCPGFIDILNHSDSYWQLFLNPSLDSLVYQGITTAIGGNCGSSPAPLAKGEMINSMQKWVDIRDVSINWLSMADFLAELDKKQLSINYGMQIGHSTLRRSFTSDESRPLERKEMEVFKQLLEDGIDQGAFGLSFGLVYSHARKTSTAEISQLAEVLKVKDALMVSHVRNEMDKLVESVEEILEVAQNTGVNTEISHLKSVGKSNWPQFEEVLERIQAANEKGVKINFDMYPYTQTGSVLYIYLPAWVTEGGKLMMLQRLKDKKLRQKAVAEMQEDDFDYSKMHISIASKVLNKGLAQRSIGEIAKTQEKSPEEVVIDLLLASDGRVITSAEVLSEDNLIAGFENDLSIVGTNGSGYVANHRQTGEKVHPRNFGAFPRFLNMYVKEKKILTWEKAVQKITKMPAEKVGLSKRGELKEANIADVVVLDPKKIKDLATIEAPYQYSTGIETVIVNGQMLLNGGEMNAVRVGKVLRKES